jgi:hypothetical protein
VSLTGRTSAGCDYLILFAPCLQFDLSLVSCAGLRAVLALAARRRLDGSVNEESVSRQTNGTNATAKIVALMTGDDRRRACECAVAESGEFALDPAVAPGGVLPCQT